MLAVITGTRPEIIKMFPIMKELVKENIEYKHIHTGQHYDSKMDITVVVYDDPAALRLLEANV